MQKGGAYSLGPSLVRYVVLIRPISFRKMVPMERMVSPERFPVHLPAVYIPSGSNRIARRMRHLVRNKQVYRSRFSRMGRRNGAAFSVYIRGKGNKYKGSEVRWNTIWAWNSGKPYVQSYRPLGILWHTLLATVSRQTLFHLTSLPLYSLPLLQ